MDISNFLGFGNVSADATLSTAAIVTLLLVSIWSLVWKGIALWKAGRKDQPIWFIVMLVVNTVGILEILYIFIFSKMNYSKNQVQAKKKKK